MNLDFPAQFLAIGDAADLTPEQLRDLLAAMGRDDPERAHGLADTIMEAALSSIAHGETSDPARLARTALTVVSAEFHRWCA